MEIVRVTDASDLAFDDQRVCDATQSLVQISIWVF